jgi:hypothetical protein
MEGRERDSAAGLRDGADVAPAASVDALVYKKRGGTSLLAGAMAPSCDRAGRPFPLVAASELVLEPLITEHPETLPLVLEQVWALTGRLVLDLQALDREAIEAARWSAELELSVEEALATYRGWTNDLSLDDLVELVFDGDGSRAARAIALIEEAVRPYRGIEEPDTPLSLRLPLGRVGGAAVCFWLDFVKRLAGWRRTLPSFFWSHDGVSGALMLHLGRIPAVALSELWRPTGERDEVCDLVLAGPGAWCPARVGAWQRLLAEPDQRISDLLRAAQRGRIDGARGA